MEMKPWHSLLSSGEYKKATFGSNLLKHLLFCFTRSAGIIIRSSPSTMSGTALYISLLCLLSVASACYISNCPIGGKRSLIDAPSRKCMACGPGDRGRCFGPSICCAAGLGCYVGSPEAAGCVEENYLPSPCENGGRPCGSEGGRCAAPGLCCHSEGCTTDQSCLAEDETEPDSNEGLGGDVLMKLLHLARQHPASRNHQ